MEPTNRDRPVTELLSGRAEVGDFVWTAGPRLAEVREIRLGDFGYESYLVEFLDREGGPRLDEEWLPAPALVMFMRYSELAQGTRTTLAEHGVRDLGTEQDRRASCRAGALEAWQLGLRQYTAQLIQAARNADG